MKMIILAAGQGTRLKPLTNNKPKCMVKYENRAIIDYILEATNDCNIKKIAVIDGYKKEVLQEYLKNENITFYTNTDFNTTNMVSTLFCAKSFMDESIIISYADIVYKKEVLQKLIDDKNDFSVIVDKNWKALWSQRMDNPLEDAETLKIKDDKIVEIGKKPHSYNDIEGQYIGLIKISKSVINKIIEFYDSLQTTLLYDGKDFDNMYMTSFIQMIIDNKIADIKPVYIQGKWIEIDTQKDLNVSMS